MEINWEIILQVIGVIGGIATFLAFLLGPMFYLGTKIENFRNEMRGELEELRKENKDFHGRLCAIEEKNKK